MVAVKAKSGARVSRTKITAYTSPCTLPTGAQAKNSEPTTPHHNGGSDMNSQHQARRKANKAPTTSGTENGSSGAD